MEELQRKCALQIFFNHVSKLCVNLKYHQCNPRIKIGLSKEFDNPIPARNSGTLALNDTVLIVSAPSGEPMLYAFELSENETNPFDSTASLLEQKHGFHSRRKTKDSI